MSETTQETFEGLVNKGVASELARKRLARDQRHVNEMLHELGRASQVSVPLDRVNEMLVSCGFDELEPMILCGREGRLHESVGRNRWLALSWYKMESGRYEVIAYVS